MNDYACLVPAAGLSSRMLGEHKLLKLFNGKPLIASVIQQLEAMSFQQLLIVLGARADDVQAALDHAPIEQSAHSKRQTIYNSQYESGLHSSIRAGLSQCRSTGVVIALADQPFEIEQNINRLLLKKPGEHDLLRSSHEGRIGHPVYIGSAYFNEILSHPDGDFGCAYLFKKYADRVQVIEQPVSAVIDLDTPDDWLRWGPE